MVKDPVLTVDKVLQAATTSTETAMASLIVTSSLEVGTEAPPHVAVELHTPETDATLAAAFT
jgi:hypothetical protein